MGSSWSTLFLPPLASLLQSIHIFMTKPSEQALFPSIGNVAQQTDQLPDIDASSPLTSETPEDDRAVQEIESLCINCEEQARYLVYVLSPALSYICSHRALLGCSLHLFRTSEKSSLCLSVVNTVASRIMRSNQLGSFDVRHNDSLTPVH